MGCPKELLLDSEGTTLAEVQLRRLSPHFPDLMMLGGPTGVACLYGERRLRDCAPFQGLGPLAGLLTGLRHSRSPWLALLPIDCPLFPAQAFFQALNRSEPGDSVIGFRPQASRPQWLPGLYHQALIPIVEKALRSGQLSLRGLLDAVPHRFLPWEDDQVCAEQAFSNMNTPEQAALLGFEVPPQRA